MPKYVVSSTLHEPDWNNSTVLEGDAANEVSTLKQELTGEILVPASFQLVRTLMEHDLVDELRLKIYPVVLGDGKRLRRDQRRETHAPRRHQDDRWRRRLPHLRARPRRLTNGEGAVSMNYYDTLIEVADDCPAKEAQVPQAKGAKKTKAVVEYELLAKHPYKYTEEDIAFEMYAVLHDIPKAIWPTERKKFLSKGHPHLRVSALAKRYGWGIHNNAEGKIALVAVESPEYKQLLNDPRITKIRAFRSKRA